MKRPLLVGVALLGLLISPVRALEQPEAFAPYETFVADNGREVAVYRMAGTLSLPGDYLWWYGCMPTSAGMMMGHYDVNGYQSTPYPNLVPGGNAENETFVGPPTGSAANANKAIASSRHVSDFYNDGPDPGTDPYGDSGEDVAGAPTGPLDCLADFMGTSQDSVQSSNGSTWFYAYTNGTRLYVKDADAWGATVPASTPTNPSYDYSGMYGMFEYLQYSGYFLSESAGTSTRLFNQYIQGYSTTNPTNGFTWQDYKNEIDAGRPVMLHIVDPPLGHAMYGTGYQEPAGPTGPKIVELCDTWSIGHGTGTPHTMTWGGTYVGGTVTYTHYAVTTMDLGGTAQGILVTGFAGNWDYQDSFNPPDQLIITKWANDMGPFDLEITVTGGIDPINILEEVYNNTGIAWTDYHFELGYGLGPAFQRSSSTDGLFFISGSSLAFPLMTPIGTPEWDELSFAGGTVPPLSWADFNLWVDLPNGVDPFIFTLRQWPTTSVIPEPAALVLAALGFWCLLMAGFRLRGSGRRTTRS